MLSIQGIEVGRMNRRERKRSLIKVFSIIYKIVKSLSRVRLFVTSQTVAYQACPWDSPGKSTGVGCHFLLQGIFPTQGSNPDFPHCRQTLYRLSHQGRLFTKCAHGNDLTPSKIMLSVKKIILSKYIFYLLILSSLDLIF